MKRAALFDQVEAVDGVNFSIWEMLLNHAESPVVVFVLAKCRDDYPAIYDEKVDVRGGEDRQPPARNFAGFRQGNVHDIEAKRAQAAAVLLEN